jgi:hypothetical protein
MKRGLLIIAILLCGKILFAQSVKEIEDKMLYYLDKLHSHSNYFGDANDDSLSLYNNELSRYLLTVLEKQPLTLQAKFGRINKVSMDIATSSDKKFRIYSWGTQDGGTMQGFNSVFQFQSGKFVHTEILYADTFKDGEWLGPGLFYPKIYTIQAQNNKTYYMAIRNGIYSSKDVSTGIKAFTIENDRINDSIKIFKTAKNILNSIDCEYDYFSNYNDKTAKENYLLHLSDDNHTLFVPLIDGEKMTGRFLIYKFDGYNFIFDKNAK